MSPTQARPAKVASRRTGRPTLRPKHVGTQVEKPEAPEKARRPEYKTCYFTTVDVIT